MYYTRRIYLGNYEYDVIYSGEEARGGNYYDDEGEPDTFIIEDIYCVDFKRDVTDLLKDSHYEIMQIIIEDYHY
jgi:hypothetical protein